MQTQNTAPDIGATSINEGVGSAVSGVVDSTKQAASEMGDQLQHQLASHANQHREQAAEGLASVANAVRRMGTEIKGGDQQSPVTQFAAHYGESLAVQVERAATYLRERDASAIMTDLEGVARRSPAVFLGCAFLLGLMGTRFLKSSRPATRYMNSMPDPNRALPAPSYSGTQSGSWASTYPQTSSPQTSYPKTAYSQTEADVLPANSY